MRVAPFSENRGIDLSVQSRCADGIRLSELPMVEVYIMDLNTESLSLNFFFPYDIRVEDRGFLIFLIYPAELEKIVFMYNIIII